MDIIMNIRHDKTVCHFSESVEILRTFLLNTYNYIRIGKLIIDLSDIRVWNVELNLSAQKIFCATGLISFNHNCCISQQYMYMYVNAYASND